VEGDPDLPPWAGLSRRGLFLWSGAFAVAYVLSAWAVKAFDLPGAYSPWYPPAGIMLAFLLVAGPRLLPVALAVRIVSDLILFPEVVRDQGLTVILLRSLVVATVYAWAAWVLRRSRLDHARLPQFGWFVAIGVAAARCSWRWASPCSMSCCWTSRAATPSAQPARSGSAMPSRSSIVPFVLLSAFAVRNGKARPQLPVSVAERVEIAGQAVALVLVPIALFALEQDNGLAPFLFVAILPVIWVALRQDLVLASAGILLTNTVVAIGAASARRRCRPRAGPDRDAGGRAGRPLRRSGAADEQHQPGRSAEPGGGAAVVGDALAVADRPLRQRRSAAAGTRPPGRGRAVDDEQVVAALAELVRDRRRLLRCRCRPRVELDGVDGTTPSTPRPSPSTTSTAPPPRS
jgi:hypothetical protein